MRPFTELTAVAVPLDLASVDTDQLAPSRFLRRPRSGGYQDFMLHDLRFESDGQERGSFVMNQPAFRGARIIVAAGDFGVGSSREQAVWGLVDYGVRCVIAVDFGDIFSNNAVKQGLLLIRQSEGVTSDLRAKLHARPGSTMTVDLEEQSLTAPDGKRLSFEIEAGRKRRLLLGLDDIGLTLQLNEDIAEFEDAYRGRRPWLFGKGSRRVSV